MTAWDPVVFPSRGRFGCIGGFPVLPYKVTLNPKPLPRLKLRVQSHCLGSASFGFRDGLLVDGGA